MVQLSLTITHACKIVVSDAAVNATTTSILFIYRKYSRPDPHENLPTSYAFLCIARPIRAQLILRKLLSPEINMNKSHGGDAVENQESTEEPAGPDRTAGNTTTIHNNNQTDGTPQEPLPLPT